MFGFNDYKLERVDILLAKKVESLFSKEEIYNILNLITSKDIISTDIEKIDAFFNKLKNALEADYRWETLIIDFCTLYTIDIETVIPALKKTNIFSYIKGSREKKNKAFVSLFF